MELDISTLEPLRTSLERTSPDMRKLRSARTPRIKVECLECGQRFSTRSMIPTCPSCNGSDVDLA